MSRQSLLVYLDKAAAACRSCGSHAEIVVQAQISRRFDAGGFGTSHVIFASLHMTGLHRRDPVSYEAS